MKRFSDSKYRKLTLLLIIFVLAIIIFRLILPTLVKNELNFYLEHRLEHYTGHIGDIDLALIREAYKIQDLTIYKKKLPLTDPPFITLADSDIALSWRALFRGKILADVKLKKLRLNFVDNEGKRANQNGTDEKGKNWQAVFDKLIPIKINNLELTSSAVHFQNPHARPVPIDIFASEMNVTVNNISNRDREQEHSSSLQGTGKLMESGVFQLAGKFNLLKKDLDWDSKLVLKRFELKKINPFLRHYANVDLSAGKLESLVKMDIHRRHINGELKFFFKNIDVVGRYEEFTSIKNFFSEILAAIGMWAFKNGKTKESAFVVRVKGTVKHPDTSLWQTLLSGLRHGLIEAIKKQI